VVYNKKNNKKDEQIFADHIISNASIPTTINGLLSAKKLH
jgi:hypothetical protein